jgi:hypothetical protein
MTLSKAFNILVLSAALSMPAMAASSYQRITTEQVAAAIRSAGLNVLAEQVELLSNVKAKTAEPILRVESIGPWEGNLAQVRVGCRSEGDCLPFVVTVRRDTGKGSTRTYIPPNLQSTTHTPPVPKPAVVVRSGSPAVLLLDGGRVHIQLAVVCLENGAVGQTIRVAIKGQEHTYMAEVSSDGSLRGTL